MNREIRAEWLTYSEAQEISGYEGDTLRHLVSSEKIAASGKGRHIRLNRRSLEAYMWTTLHDLDRDARAAS